ncbi:MAG: F420-dependent methylenetetrahydromethanopterin dehydrogenase [Gammaproteobacteria bacterium]
MRLVAAGHVMLRAAARLADEARELEKSADSLARTPHAANGAILRKTALDAKPG